MMVMRTDTEIRGLVNPGENLISVDGMFFDLGKLLIAQFPLFVENIFMDSDLSDVMEKRGIIYLSALFFRIACPLRDLSGIQCHPGRMAMGVSVFGIDRIDKGFGGLFKHDALSALGFLVGFNFISLCLFYASVHFTQSVDEKHNHHKHHGDIGKRETIAEDLHKGHEGRKRDAYDHGGRKHAVQTIAVLDQHGFLKNNHRQRNDIAENKPGSPLIVVHLVKRVIQTGKLRNDHQRRAGKKQPFTDPEPLRGKAKPPLFTEKIIHIACNQMRDKHLHEINHSVAETNHHTAEFTEISPVEIGSPVKQQQKHRSNFHHCQDALAFGRQGSRNRGQNSENTADSAHKQHDVQLMFLKKQHSITFSLQCFLGSILPESA